MKGRFLVIEGGDGTGKSTQLRLMREYFDAHNIDALFTREPGGTVISEAAREIILNPEYTQMCGMTELMLYSAARAQHIEELIKPELKKGRLIVCDRFTASTIAYQGVARGMDIDAITELNRLACGGINPDITLFLDIPPNTAAERKAGRENADRMEKEDALFHERVYEGYMLAEEITGSSFVRIDASGDKNATHNKIIDKLYEYNIIPQKKT